MQNQQMELSEIEPSFEGPGKTELPASIQYIQVGHGTMSDTSTDGRVYTTASTIWDGTKPHTLTH